MMKIMTTIKTTKLLFQPLLFVLTLVFTLITPAIAQEEGILDSPWKFHVNLYGWLPEAPATITRNDKVLADVPEDLDTILESMDATAMFELEAHKGPLVLFLNNVYYKGEYNDHFIGKESKQRRKFTFEEEVWAVKYGAGYKLDPIKLGDKPDSADVTLIPWVGAFYFHDDWETKVSAAPPFDGVDVDGTLEFNTPMVGLGSRWNLSKNWYLNLSYGQGGWDVDDVDEIYDILGNFVYRFKMGDVSSKFIAGYRYLHIDYDDGTMEVDVDVKGPFLGFGWEF